MVFWTDFYPAWFLDNHSEKTCIHMQVRIIKVDEWVDSVFLPEFILPTDFHLTRYAQADRIHILCFRPKIEGHGKILIHPDLLMKIFRRSVRQLIKQQENNSSIKNSLKIFIYGNRTIH